MKMVSTEVFRWSSFQDAYALTKPSITLMSVIVAAGAMTLVTVAYSLPVDVGASVAILAGIALSVMGAGAVNMAFEHELDAKMSRTRDRPIASGRMGVGTGYAIGGILSILAHVCLAVAGASSAIALTALAQVSYLAFYTPLKQRSAWAVVVGALPGALPILIGTAGLTGTLEPLGLILFLMMCVWQLPHFFAISIYRREEYTRAGYRVIAEVMGTPATKMLTLSTTIALVMSSAVLWAVGGAGLIYLVCALAVGTWFLFVIAAGLRPQDEATDAKWARKVFFASLIYQVAVFVALAIDAGARVIPDGFGL